LSIAQKEADWNDIRDWARPIHPYSVLDIGSGTAGIHKYLVPDTTVQKVHLMDGGKAIPSQMGWNPNGTTPWRDVNDGVGRLKGMKWDIEITGHKARPNLVIPVDLIISMKSWGFHYPISTYLELARNSLNKGGRIITDLRKNTGQIEVLAKWFHLVELDVGRSGKCFRTVWEHKER